MQSLPDIRQFTANINTFQAIMNKCLLSVLLTGRGIEPNSDELMTMYKLGKTPSPFFRMVYGYAIECREGRVVIRDIHNNNEVIFNREVIE